MESYAIYQPRTRQIERIIVYAMLGMDALEDAQSQWPQGYRRVATVSASSPAQAAILGGVLMGDVLVPATGFSFLATGEGFSRIPRPAARRRGPVTP